MTKFRMIIISFLFLLASCAKPIDKDYSFKMSVLDVGKGDAIVVECDDEVLLVDTGYEETYDTLKDFLKSEGIDTINYLVITHYDKDHFGGTVKLLDDFKIETIYLPGYEATSNRYLSLIAKLEEKKLFSTKVDQNLAFKLGSADILIHATKLEYDGTNDNNMSLALSINHGVNSFFLAGDAEKKRLAELSEEISQTYDVYKVPHHGRVEKNSESFLSLIKPKYGIITCSDEERPEEELLSLLEKQEVVIYTSVDDGLITLLSDGTHDLVVQGN